MATDGNIDYALARLWAHHVKRLRASVWRRLEASRYLAQYLDAVRSSTLAKWVFSIDCTCDGHAIKRSLRIAWRSYVDCIAAWHLRLDSGQVTPQCSSHCGAVGNLLKCSRKPELMGPPTEIPWRSR